MNNHIVLVWAEKKCYVCLLAHQACTSYRGNTAIRGQRGALSVILKDKQNCLCPVGDRDYSS